MTRIQKSALVRYPARLMLELVQNVEAYPDFLPWCSASRILERDHNGIAAELDVARGGFRKSFSTRNKIIDDNRLRMSLIKGPFNHLEGIWTFEPLREDACKVSLDLEFELTGKLSDLAFGKIFGHIANTLVNAFTQRAKEIYG